MGHSATARARIRDHAFDAFIRNRQVEGRNADAGLHGAEHGFDHLEAVVHEHGGAVAALQPERNERVGDLFGAPVELAPGQRTRSACHGNTIAPPSAVQSQDVGKQWTGCGNHPYGDTADNFNC